MKKILTVIAAFALACTLSCKKDTRKVTVFHAGSLAVPMKHLKKSFEKKHPGIEVLLESSGSRAAARKISDLHKPCDIMASADYSVINNLLMPEYASFNIRFATNEMAIVYTAKSRYADKINTGNWYKILLKDDVSYGHSDPERDPCGYRSQLVWQLAEKHYREPGLYGKLRAGCPKKNIRPKEVDLIGLIEAGALDYIFLYRSVAIQHDLPFVELPPQISLGDPAYNSFYKKAYVDLTGKKPGQTVRVRGESMVYGITMVKNPVNRKDALSFLAFMLGNEGMDIIKSLGQGPIMPALTSEYGSVPEELKKYVKGVR